MKVLVGFLWKMEVNLVKILWYKPATGNPECGGKV
jgi:hypothetical protein